MDKRLPLLTLLVVTGALVASCGGEDRLTESEFLAQGNEICAGGDERLQAAAEEIFADVPPGEQPDEAQLQEFLDTFLADINGQLDDLEALSPPEDMEEDADALFAAARDKLNEIEGGGTEILLSGEDPFADVNVMADELGLTDCGGD